MDDSEVDTLPYIKFSPKEVQKFSKVTISTPDNNCYNFTNEKRGIAVIIVNDKYQGSQRREGWEKDMQLLQTTFASYGFEIRCFCDKTAEVIVREIKNISKEDHSRSDCLIIAISTHGDSSDNGRGVKEDIIYASDEIIKTKVILENFTDDKCPSLKGKPRLVFIQACRGNRLDDGAEVKYRSPLTRPPSDKPDLTDCITVRPAFIDDVDAKLDAKKESNYKQNDSFDSEKASMNITLIKSHQTNKNTNLKTSVTGGAMPFSSQPLNNPVVYPAPCYKDFLVMYATPPGYFAFRRTTDGSWFISCLCKILEQHAESTENIMTILTKVVSQVALEMVSKNTDKAYDSKKQSPVIYSRLTKDVVLTRKN